jgi:hypothetical protein
MGWDVEMGALDEFKGRRLWERVAEDRFDKPDQIGTPDEYTGLENALIRYLHGCSHPILLTMHTIQELKCATSEHVGIKQYGTTVQCHPCMPNGKHQGSFVTYEYAYDKALKERIRR